MTRAGAGAGKTTGLVTRVIDAYQAFRARGETPRIVLTTFTRKATQELKERLIARACEARDPGLLQFVSDPSRLQIATIHGLLNQFLRQVGHLAGLDAGFQIVTEPEGRQLARLALREVLIERGEGLDLLEVYGFERTLTMCRLYESAWREFGELKPATRADIEAAAHEEASYWRRCLTKLGRDIVTDVPRPKWQTYGTALVDFVNGWDGDCATIEVPRKPSRSKSEPELDGWHDRIDDEVNRFKKEMKRPCWGRAGWDDMVRTWRDFAPVANAFAERLDAVKEGQARFEMNDLELKSVQILRAKPYLGTIFAENWDYWMIDEYQDTSPLQVACLKALIGDAPKYFVGDPQQSIYLFRGAEVGVFDDAERAVRAGGGEVTELRRNWRSQPDLLHFINDLMLGVGTQFSAMEPRTEPGRHARVCAKLIRANDAGAEMDAMVSRVTELVAVGARLEQICVVGRTHANLMSASRALKSFGYPTHVHSSRGFNSRREVVDAQALWKFLVNPHDNLNLLILLRSPWFFVPDARLAELGQDRPSSLWQHVGALDEAAVPDGIRRLRTARARLDDDGLVRTFETTLLDASYLDLALANDPAGRKESNLWKIILKARALEREGGASALDLLGGGGGDPLDAAEGDAASAQEPNCINLMTIHGAKGLEFDHVILPAAGAAPQLSQTPPLAVRDGTFFFPVLDETTGESTASPLDFLANRARGRREVVEFDRWLYVALTRAKETLTMIWSQPAAASWAARAGPCRQPAGLYTAPTPGETYAYEVTEEWAPPAPYAGAPSAGSVVRAPFGIVYPPAEERRSVTELVETKRRTMDTQDLIKRWRAQNAGTRIHRALEALKYGRGRDLVGFDDALSYVVGITDPPLAELIKTGETEWGFQVQAKTGVIEGQIDLWAKHDGRLYVIDYKTGSDAFREDAFTQLQIYAWALGRFGHAEPATLMVIYPLARKFETRPFDAGSRNRWEVEFGGA